MAEAFRILIVEDEPLIAMVLEDYIENLGHILAGTADSVDSTLPIVAAGEFDAAILDVHLRGGEVSWPVADALLAAGKKFIIATGGHVEPPPERFADVPVLTKPFTMDGVRNSLSELLAN